MLGSLSTNLEIGKKLEKIINEKKIIKHSENISYVNAYHQVVYIYDNEETKAKHKEELISKGWSMIDSQDYIDVYFSFHNEKNSIYKPCGVFQKKVECCFQL